MNDRPRSLDNSPALLVVDDDIDERNNIAAFLENLGFTIKFADNPRDALESARTAPPDMIIAKANIARVGGCCLCTDLKLNPKTNMIPVLMYSQDYDESLVKQAFQLGASDFLTGPTIQWTMLRNRIEQILKYKDTEHELRFLSKVFSATNEGIIITDVAKKIIKVNNGFCKVTGYTESEVVGKNPRFLQSGRQDQEFYVAMWDSINQTGQWEGEIWNRRKSNEVYAEWLNISEIHDNEGKTINYVGIFSDITAVESKHEHISHLAYHDFLTGLANRMLLEERVSQAILSAERTKVQLALMYIDIDRFKPVNDELGHGAGDELLIEVANRLSTCVRQSDTLARIGGDEFMILLAHLSNRQDAEFVAKKILNAMAQPFSIQTKNLDVGCSIGISLFPDDGSEFHTLLNNADAAMYQSKKQHLSTYRFCSEE